MNNGAWCWFSDPRAIYSPSRNRSYVGWVSPTGDIMARQIDHATGQDKTVVVHAALNQDDHANPSFVELPNGRVIIFYAHHQASDILYRWTGPNGDIASLGGPLGVGVGAFSGGTGPFSYANPVFLSQEGRLMLFFRQAYNGRNRWLVAVNMDQLNTNSWGGYSIWDCGGARGPYLKVCSNGVNRADLLLSDGHPAYDKPTSIYHLRYLYDGVSHWQTSAGANLAGVNYAPSQLMQVLSGASVGNSWIWQIAYGPDGHPWALLSTYPGDNRHDHRYRFARFNGASWVTSEICAAGDGLVDNAAEGYYSAGACFDGNDPTKIYLALQDATGWRVEMWQTWDFGATWASVSVVSPAALSHKQLRPFSPKGYGANAAGVWWFKGRYTNYLDYDADLKATGLPLTELEQLLAACHDVQVDNTIDAPLRSLAQKLEAYLS